MSFTRFTKRMGKRPTPRVFCTLLGMLACIVLILPAVTNAQWRATVGAQSEDKARQALAFLPNEIWIHAGDNITWTADADDIHTITFLTSGQVRLPFSVGCPGFSPSGSSFDGSTCVSAPQKRAGEPAQTLGT
jgi:plastocyanin